MLVWHRTNNLGLKRVLYQLKTPAGYDIWGGHIPCTCGKSFVSVDLFYVQQADYDGRSDISQRRLVNVGLAVPPEL